MSVEQQPFVGSAIHFLTGPMVGNVLHLSKPRMEIGRGALNDIIVLDPKVSRQHAQLSYVNGIWYIENLSSHMLAVDTHAVRRAMLLHKSVVKLSEETSFELLVGVEAGQTSPSSLGDTLPQKDSTIPRFPASEFDSTVIALPVGIPSLVVSNNLSPEKQVYTLTQDVLSLGRDVSNDIVILEQVVSNFHAQIMREDNQFVLIHPPLSRDKTRNGLFFQGQHIPGEQSFRRVLTRGDVFRIGDEYGTLVTLTFHDGTDAAQEPVPILHPIALQSPMLSIGRLPDNDVVLSHPQVSAHHARLERTANGGYRLLDLKSTNHVYVNTEAISDHLLHVGDEIRIGPFRLIYTGSELTERDESNNIRIDALNLKKVVNKHVVLLNDISLSIPPRSFVALVGSSGAGKTTLMDALNGLRPAQEGMVLYNGKDYFRNRAAFSTQLGYVPQDDIVHRELTVERALYYAARLRLPNDFTKEQIQQRIDDVLEDVEMIDQRALLVNKLSGGQRKRVSIALELLANPGVFFLDEPTSGLDPGLDRKMMFLLRRLADRGRTIILVTHATNNINVCDYICFLAQGGRVAYFGPPDEAKAFFDKSDFAEIYGTLEATKAYPQVPQEAEARFRASPDYQKYVAEPLKQQTTVQETQQVTKRAKTGNAWRQFLLLSLRSIELLRNDTGNLLILLLQAPIIGILIVLMVHSQFPNVFNANVMMQCSSQVPFASGSLTLPITKQGAGLNCMDVLNFLQSNRTFVGSNLTGEAYAQQNGGALNALQKFIPPGSGMQAQKVLFLMIFAAILFGCVNGSREIVKEAAIYRRERAVNLGILPYMFSKIAVFGLLCLLQSAILVGLIELGEPLHQGILLPVVLETYVTIALTALAGLMYGLTISVIAPNNDRAVSLVPLVLIPQVVFAGALIPLTDWGTQIIAVIFPTRWALVALSTSIGLHDDKISGNKLFGNDYASHSTLFSTYTHNEAVQRLLLSWLMLGVIMVVLLCIVGFFLKRKDVRK